MLSFLTVNYIPCKLDSRSQAILSNWLLSISCKCCYGIVLKDAISSLIKVLLPSGEVDLSTIAPSVSEHACSEAIGSSCWHVESALGECGHYNNIGALSYKLYISPQASVRESKGKSSILWIKSIFGVWLCKLYLNYSWQYYLGISRLQLHCAHAHLIIQRICIKITISFINCLLVGSFVSCDRWP